MKNLYTYKQIKDKIETCDYSSEMLLMHLLLRYEELEKERDEARREAEMVRDYPKYKHKFGWVFSWEEDS